MKVALVHELLTTKGGAERVAKIFAEMFPQANIFTLLYDEKKLGDWFKGHQIITPETSLLCKLKNSQFNHHLYLNKFPRWVEAWDFRGYDLVLSSSSAFVHGLRTNGNPPHICYVHSPARYLWDATHDVLERAGQSWGGFLKCRYLEHQFHKLRLWDAEVAPRPDLLLAASHEVKRRIELYWRRSSTVVYPPLADDWFTAVESGKQTTTDYFLIVSTLARYKQIDRAIAACNQLKIPLKIVGAGPDASRLKTLAGPTVEFLGYQEGPALKTLYSNARAVIFPGHEDFGLVPLEAMACGTPVIAQDRGGALETVIANKTGTFFKAEDSASLTQTIANFDPTKFRAEDCKNQAGRFRREEFEKKIWEQVTSVRDLRDLKD